MKKFLILLFLFISCASIDEFTEIQLVEEKVLIKADDYDIPAIITRIQDVNNLPLVVMLHGTGSQKDEAADAYKMLARALALNKIASVRFDFPGSGESKVSYRLYSNSSAIKDAITVASSLAKSNYIDKERIGILGWSQGGTDALLAAGSSDIFKSVGTWAASLNLSSIATKEMREHSKEKGYALLEFPWRSSLELDQKWIDEADSMDILSYVSKIKAPIASFHGINDDVVPFEDSEKVQEASTNSESKLIAISDTDHLYGLFSGSLTKFNELRDLTINWFLDTL